MPKGGAGFVVGSSAIPPHQKRGALMQLNGFEDLEQLVASTGIVSFMELVDDIFKGSRAEGEGACMSSWQYWIKPLEEICFQQKKCLAADHELKIHQTTGHLSIASLPRSPLVLVPLLPNCRTHCRGHK